MNPDILFPLFWIAWAVSWFGAALWSSRAQRRVPWRESWTYRSVLTLGIVMITGQTSHYLRVPRLWDLGHNGGGALAYLMLPGFAFAWWARIHLGRLWSGSVTRKEDHRIIDTGPYGIVRHPIYTGLIWAIILSAVAVGTILSVLGIGVTILGFWMKARLEESFLMQELGPQAYDAYRRRVPMLLPFG